MQLTRKCYDFGHYRVIEWHTDAQEKLLRVEVQENGTVSVTWSTSPDLTIAALFTYVNQRLATRERRGPLTLLVGPQSPKPGFDVVGLIATTPVCEHELREAAQEEWDVSEPIWIRVEPPEPDATLYCELPLDRGSTKTGIITQQKTFDLSAFQKFLCMTAAHPFSSDWLYYALQRAHVFPL